MQYLGHVISKDGIMVDPQKTKEICDWLVPKYVADIRLFMGLTGYYRRFIEGFSRISYPITSLQKKGVRFVWSLKCQEIFGKHKELLTKAHVLKVQDPYKDYTVYTYASKEGVGGVFSQNGHVVCYKSRKLKEH